MFLLSLGLSEFQALEYPWCQGLGWWGDGPDSSCDYGFWEESNANSPNGCSSRCGRTSVGYVDHNPLLDIFVLAGDPFETFQAFMLRGEGGALVYANNEHRGGWVLGCDPLEGNTPWLQPAIAMKHLGLSFAHVFHFQENI